MKLNFIMIAAFLNSYTYSQEIPVLNDSINKIQPRHHISRTELFGGPNILYPKVYSKDLSPGDGINWGYSLGVNFVHLIKKKLNLVGGIFFERKRFKNKNSNASQFYSGNLKNDYLTFSITSRYSFLNDHFYIGIGGYLGILQKSKTSIFYTDLNTGTVVYSTQSSYSLNHKYDAGLLVVLGYTFSINKRISFNCQFMNTNGFKRVGNTSPFYNSLTIERNNNICFLTGITFNR